MIADWPSGTADRARVHAALGEPARLAVVDLLLLGDASPGEVGRRLGLPGNLLAHHVKLLEQAGIVRRSRSEGDRRRTYLRLRTAALADLVPTGVRRAPRVVFVCSRNSARSQLAAALWHRRSRVPTASAGTRPADRVHPLAVATARAHGLSLTRARTHHLRDVLRPDDLVVAVCDSAHEELADHDDRLHWSVPDPAAAGTPDAFDAAYRDLADRVDRLVPAVHPATEDS
ncbi:helix-turn-helix domain-containing protein [Saccharothrix sp. S26]|uniref:arsenate reductase/protein-tyrosine-phosphatase family protein n=1 Tax=Saccharothrix sp. S26 TaxID=2907215 RepID=UPI001F3887FC|nr:helix-turn-helix domain-containing protein [Saccharothrix sp. S26]MCE7000763.1 helix-turn-helix domain-containing protein [Saccharothrix sp. S26]